MCVPKPQLPALQPTLAPSMQTADALQLGGMGNQATAGLGRLALRLGGATSTTSSVTPAATSTAATTAANAATPAATSTTTAPAATPAVSPAGSTVAQGGQVAPGYNALALVGQRFGIGGSSAGFTSGAAR